VYFTADVLLCCTVVRHVRARRREYRIHPFWPLIIKFCSLFETFVKSKYLGDISTRVTFLGPCGRFSSFSSCNSSSRIQKSSKGLPLHPRDLRPQRVPRTTVAENASHVVCTYTFFSIGVCSDFAQQQQNGQLRRRKDSQFQQEFRRAVSG